MNLKNVKKVYYHRSCPDGTMSAFIIQCAMQELQHTVEFIGVTPNTTEYEEALAEDGQIWVDVSPPLKRWKEWIGKKDVLVLDHHPSTKEVAETLGIYRDNTAHCGAMLAYEEVYVPVVGEIASMRYMANLAMIRDTWKKQDALWKNAVCFSLALEFFGVQKLIDFKEQYLNRKGLELSSILEVGENLYSKMERVRNKYVSTADLFQAGTLKVALYNCTEKMSSDVGNYLIENKGVDVAISWSYLKEDSHKIILSLRCRDGLSLLNLVKGLSGGGHAQAAGGMLPGDEWSQAAIREELRFRIAALAESGLMEDRK